MTGDGAVSAILNCVCFSLSFVLFVSLEVCGASLDIKLCRRGVVRDMKTGPGKFRFPMNRG